MGRGSVAMSALIGGTLLGVFVLGCGTADGPATMQNGSPCSDITPENDSDGDGITDGVEHGDCDYPAVDSDADGVPDYQDSDSDNDGVMDGVDSCRRVANPGQADCNADGIGDACAPPSSVLLEKCGPAGDCGCGLTCENNVCLGTNGQGCTADDQCTDTCVRGSCVPFGKTGDACESAFDCVSGYCGGTQCQLLYQERNITSVCAGCTVVSNSCNGEITPATTCNWNVNTANAVAGTASQSACQSVGGTWSGYFASCTKSGCVPGNSRCTVPNMPL